MKIVMEQIWKQIQDKKQIIYDLLISVLSYTYLNINSLSLLLMNKKK